MGSNPAQGIKSFSSDEKVIQKVVRPWSFLNSLQLATFRRGLDCESIGDPSFQAPGRISARGLSKKTEGRYSPSTVPSKLG